MKRFLALLCCVVAWICPVGHPQGEPTPMTTFVECYDGNQADVAISHADVTTLLPNEERIYLAQGRRIAQHVVDTRARQFFGELEDLPTPPRAVEVDEARNLMFVLFGDTKTQGKRSRVGSAVFS